MNTKVSLMKKLIFKLKSVLPRRKTRWKRPKTRSCRPSPDNFNTKLTLLRITLINWLLPTLISLNNIKILFIPTMRILTRWELILDMFKSNTLRCKALMRHLNKELISLKDKEILVFYLPDTDKIMNSILSRKMPIPLLINISISKIILKQPGMILLKKEWENLMTPWDNLLTKASTNKFKSTNKWSEKRTLTSFQWLKRKKNLKVKWNKVFQMPILKIFKVNILL
jgi:hypothetical protein